MTYSSEVLADTPLVYLQLDETSGTALADSSGNSRGFTLTGATLNQSPVRPNGVKSILFGNTTGDYASSASAAWMDSADFTVEAWFSGTARHTANTIATRDSGGTNRGWALYVDASGKLTVGDATTGHAGSATLALSTAYHCVLTYSASTSTGKLYVNGALDATFTSLTLNNTVGSNDLYLAVGLYGGGGFPSLFWPADAKLDDFAFYNTALSGTRVLAHYTAGVGASVALPVLAFTLAAPAPTVTAAVSATVAMPVLTWTYTTLATTQVAAANVGLPVLTFDMGAPSPWFGGASNRPLRDIHTATLFDTDGLTRIAVLPNAVVGPWTEENSKPGHGTFRVPLTDATTALITDRRIVQLAWFHDGIRIATFAVRIQSEGVQVAVDGTRWLKFEEQPGLLSMLGDATLYPEYGLKKHSQATRIFGFMAAVGNWLRNGDWHAPAGNLLSTETTYRKNHPASLKSVDPYWIATYNPAAAVPSGKVNYFRADPPLTVADGTYCSLITTGDNYFAVYIDGEEIITPDLSNPLAWRTAEPQPITLAAGSHVIAARVENGSFPRGDHSSPIGFIFALLETDNRGKPTGTVLLKSDTTNWLSHDDTPEPGWTRAQVLRTCILEAQARGVDACNHIRFGFTDFHDSNGLPWIDIGEFSFDVGTVSVLDIAQQLSEADIDIVLRPSTMTLYAWRRRGQDLSATVQYLPGDQGGTLKSHDVQSKAARFTTVLSQTSDTTWVETTDTTAAGTAGRIETGLSLGSTSSSATAASIARGQLREGSTPLVSSFSEASVLGDPIPYLHYHLGDTITVPGRRNIGTMKARVLAITVDGSGDVTRAWPDYVGPDLSV